MYICIYIYIYIIFGITQRNKERKDPLHNYLIDVDR